MIPLLLFLMQCMFQILPDIRIRFLHTQADRIFPMNTRRLILIRNHFRKTMISMSRIIRNHLFEIRSILFRRNRPRFSIHLKTGLSDQILCLHRRIFLIEIRNPERRCLLHQIGNLIFGNDIPALQHSLIGNRECISFCSILRLEISVMQRQNGFLSASCNPPSSIPSLNHRFPLLLIHRKNGPGISIFIFKQRTFLRMQRKRSPDQGARFFRSNPEWHPELIFVPGNVIFRFLHSIKMEYDGLINPAGGTIRWNRWMQMHRIGNPIRNHLHFKIIVSIQSSWFQILVPVHRNCRKFRR